MCLHVSKLSPNQLHHNATHCILILTSCGQVVNATEKFIVISFRSKIQYVSYEL